MLKYLLTSRTILQLRITAEIHQKYFICLRKNQNINYNQIDIFSENDKKNGKKLKLTVIFDLKKDEIGDLFFKKILLINVAGLENGLRDKRDGYSYFGLKHIEVN